MKPYDGSATNILLVDDDASTLRPLIRTLERRKCGYSFHGAGSAAEALEAAQRLLPQAAVVDLCLDPQHGPESGLQLIAALQQAAPGIRVLVLTGFGAEEMGLKALEHGAASFLEKPADADHLLALIKDAVSYCALRRRCIELASAASQACIQAVGLQSRSPLMSEVLETAAFAAANAQPILITGETGTGKGVLAHAIHQAGSRKQRPFIRFQPSFAGHDLTASELFGHRKGAFTGAGEDRRGLIEEAHGGTLFIDEVADLSPEVQVMLLNVLQEKVFRRLGANRQQSSDFRLIAATNKTTEEIFEQNLLRSDFYHRIAHLTLEIPPLRRRSEDIDELAVHFVEALANREKLRIHGLAPDARKKLKQHVWPGNVRELQAVVEGAAYRAHYHRRPLIEAEDVRINTLTAKGAALNGCAVQPLRLQVENFENRLVLDALKAHDGNQSQAAKTLQLDRSSFRRILARTTRSGS